MTLKIGKRNLIIIIASVVAAILVATAIAVPLVVLTKNGTLVFDTLAVPNISVYEVKGEPDYTVTLGWNKITGAVGYYLQYYYESDVKDVVAVAEEEINKASVSGVTYTFPRKKGNLHFRICACANDEKYDSGYGEWQSYTVEALVLPLPESYELVFTKVDNVECYRATESTCNSWTPVTYTYMGVKKTISYYEVCLVSPENHGEKPTEDGIIYDGKSLLKTEFYFPYAGVWSLYIRAVNYMEFYGEKVEISASPELSTLYDIGDEWTVIEVTVAES